MLEVQRRFTGVLRRLRDELPAKTVAVFSHGDPIRGALMFYLDLPLDFLHRLKIHPGSVSIVRIGDTPQVLC